MLDGRLACSDAVLSVGAHRGVECGPTDEGTEMVGPPSGEGPSGIYAS